MQRLITIGTGSGRAVKEKRGPCHLIQTDDSVLLMDCGEGAAGMIDAMDPPPLVEAIILTHLHADHISGLFTLLQNFIIGKRSEPIDIYLPLEGINTFEAMRDTLYLSSDYLPSEPFEVSFRPLSEGNVIENDQWTIRAWQTDHFVQDREIGIRKPRTAYGLTVDWNAGGLIYTSDVASIDCFKAELKPKATLLCEAMHIDWKTVVDEARKSDVSRIIFTHPDPDRAIELERFCSEHKDLFYAYDGMEITW